jgi:hypothetical protein
MAEEDTTTMASKQSLLANLLDYEQSRAGLELVFTSSDDDDDDEFLGDDGRVIEDGDDDSATRGVARLPQQQTAKKRRTRYARLCKTASNWWKLFLSPERRAIIESNPDGRDDKKFRRLFRVPYFVFHERILPLTISKWFPTWDPNQVDGWGQPVGDLELKLMGALFVLGSGSTNFVVSLNTNLSEEVHRIFFLSWINQMSSIKDDFIYLPRDEMELRQVVEEYVQVGLPGCTGSVDCVHIGWDRCPSSMLNMYTGKEGYPSIAYEVICTSRKFIQSVSFGHPGSRNDKHIVRTDSSVMSLVEGSGWLRTRTWECVMDAEGTRKVFHGLYLLSDGGYLRWPCFAFPIKNGLAGSPTMKWSAMVESVRKDIEGVFGILKKRFLLLKNFNSLSSPKDIDSAFVTCCILHNMLLKEDGFLDSNLPDLPLGRRARLRIPAQEDPRGEGMWLRPHDDTHDALYEEEERRCGRCKDTTVLTAMWRERTEALMNHYQFVKTQRQEQGEH